MRLDDDKSDFTDDERFTEQSIEFLVDGDIQSSGTRVRATLRVIDLSDHSTIWAERFDLMIDSNDLFEQQEVITRKIASRIGSEYGQINQRRYQSILDSKPRSLNEQQLTLKYYHCNLLLNKEACDEFHKDVFEALQEEPESALVNTFAGDVYSKIYSMDLPGAEEALEKFNHYIEKAYSINPNHQLVRSSMAYKCLILNDRERFLKLLDHSKEWTASGSLRLGGLALCTCLFGEWETGKEMLDEVINNNVNIPGWIYGLLSLYHYRRAEYDQALQAAYKYQSPGLYWHHLHRLVALSQLGRLDEARSEFQALLKTRPDFVERGRYLLSLLIKETSLVEHLLEGFAKIGVKIA